MSQPAMTHQHQHQQHLHPQQHPHQPHPHPHPHPQHPHAHPQHPSHSHSMSVAPPYQSPHLNPHASSYFPPSHSVPSLSTRHGPSPPNTERTQGNKNSPKNGLDEIIRCFICFGRVEEARLCPSCSKMWCKKCIVKWLTERKPSCPFCRCSLTVNQLVNARFMDDIYSELQKMEHVKKQDHTEMCNIHDAPLHYYCTTCQDSICSDCAMFGKNHKDHEFSRLTTVYQEHVQVIQQEIAAIHTRLDHLQVLEENIEHNIRSVKSSKEDRSHELQAALQEMDTRLTAQLKAKLLTLLAQKNDVLKEAHLLESLLHELSCQLDTNICPRTILIKKTAEMMTMLKEIHNKPISHFYREPVSDQFISELLPPYDSSTYLLHDFLTHRRTTEVMYSKPLIVNGLTWRLKVYPNGNGIARNTFLSVFLELSGGFAGSNKYEYRVEMIHPTDTHRNISRVFASHFEIGECWGYNRFFRVDQLEEDGYLNPDGSLHLKFYVRAPNNHLLCKDEQRYIDYLQQAHATHLAQIEHYRNQIRRVKAGEMSIDEMTIDVDVGVVEGVPIAVNAGTVVPTTNTTTVTASISTSSTTTSTLSSFAQAAAAIEAAAAEESDDNEPEEDDDTQHDDVDDTEIRSYPHDDHKTHILIVHHSDDDESHEYQSIQPQRYTVDHIESPSHHHNESSSHHHMNESSHHRIASHSTRSSDGDIESDNDIHSATTSPKHTDVSQLHRMLEQQLNSTSGLYLPDSSSSSSSPSGSKSVPSTSTSSPSRRWDRPSHASTTSTSSNIPSTSTLFTRGHSSRVTTIPPHETKQATSNTSTTTSTSTSTSTSSSTSSDSRLLKDLGFIDNYLTKIKNEGTATSTVPTSTARLIKPRTNSQPSNVGESITSTSNSSSTAIAAPSTSTSTSATSSDSPSRTDSP